MSNENQERRRYPRLELPNNATAFDENGQRLGIVAHVSGGGMRLFLETNEQERAFTAGKRLKLTVVEDNGARTDVHVEVRYVHAADVGLEFV